MHETHFGRSLALIGTLAMLALPACKRGSAEGGGEEHAGHAEEEGLPAKSVTRWTDKSELFMEYEPPVVGSEGKFAAHLTALPSFKAVTDGKMVLVVKAADGTVLTATADKPSSPGIFRAVIRPAKAGKCSMTVSVQGPQVTDEIDAGPCEVFADQAAARVDSEKEPPGGGINFTKEQQWKTDFATVAVGERELQPSVQANGEVRPVPGREARLTAAATGRVILATPVPVIGMPVRAGQVLAVIAPRLSAGGDRATLDAEVQAARAELEAAEAQLSRAERLFKEQAVPERNVEEARARANVARARLGAATGRLDQYSAGASGAGRAGQGSFQVRSPIDGTLVSASVASGESVEEGKLLFSVIDLSRVWIEARIFEPDIPKVEGAQSAWFTIEGYENPFVIDQKNGKLVTIGSVIDPQNRTVPVIFEVENPDAKLRIGQFAKVNVATGSPVQGLAVPVPALIEDGGKFVAYVQVEGESFERRPLTISLRSHGWAGVREGLSAGERVVTKGAYEIKLTSASGAIPKHGHVH
ncbi:MAG: efflux RND transporter periplasmic adaptor subunit [Deltaproteobacteria bacterium]|nr:efflux RND transporter periplasmic adaptor subunit [Deltaproteobacteria bacterium]